MRTDDKSGKTGKKWERTDEKIPNKKMRRDEKRERTNEKSEKDR